MCDTSSIVRSACHGTSGNWLKPVKLSKWELPIPPARSYWNGVYAEIEKKYKRVRDPYPIPFPLSKPSTSSPTTEFFDNVSSKILPHKPTCKEPGVSSKFTESGDNVIKTNNAKQQNSIVTLPPCKSKLQKKLPCDIKNNESGTVKIKRQLCPCTECMKNIGSSVPKLPNLSVKKKTLAKSKSASIIRSNIDEKTTEQQTPKKTNKKAPKLGTASLLPSFAKAVSIDSSIGTHESFDSGQEPITVHNETDTNIHARKSDFLHIPNLSFVSSMSLDDSSNKEDTCLQDISIMSEEEFVAAERSLKVEKKSLSFKQEDLGKMSVRSETKPIRKRESIKNITRELDKKYAYKALDFLSTGKNSKYNNQPNINSFPFDQQFEESVPTKSVKKQTKEHKDSDSLKYFKNLIPAELQDNVMGDLTSGQEIQSTNEKVTVIQSATDYSSSQNNSGLNYFENNAELTGNNGLQLIPQTKLFRRTYFDKCISCLHKPFITRTKSYHELPLTSLVSIVNKSPNFETSSLSSTSSSELSHTESDYHDKSNFSDFSHSDGSAININTETKAQGDSESNTYLSDKRRVLSVLESSIETASLKDHSPSPKSQVDHHLRESSIAAQSSDRSRGSTPSNQSSDSEEARPQDDRLPSSKYTAPCHAPVVWRPSLEPFRALRAKKFTSMQARAAAITSKSDGTSDSDDADEAATPRKLQKKKRDNSTNMKALADIKKTKEKKESAKKPLVRMKTASENMTAFSSEDAKARRTLKRSKTTFDLTAISDGSQSEESEEEKSDERVSTAAVEKETELQQYSDTILMYRPDSPPEPIMSLEDVLEIIESCNTEQFSASDLMERLCARFTEKIEEKCKFTKDNENKKYLKLGLNLFKVLSDSRRYLKPEIFDHNIQLLQKQPPLTNPRQLRRILPTKAYELVAPILGMPKYSSKFEERKVARIRYDRESNYSTDTEISLDLIVHPGTIPDSSKRKGKSYGGLVRNPYALFLKKPRRKVVVWRPLREEDLKGYDPEATLEMRATRLMNKICEDFCEWLKHLGGNEQVIDEDTLKDMFEINFTAEACKAMQVVLKEMPTIPMVVVDVRNCREAGELEATRREIKKDLVIEKRQKRTFAFGCSLPSHLRFVPPRGKLATKWLNSDSIPKDLETMDVVWNDIMHLDSVQGFVNYAKKNPKAISSTCLKNLETRTMNPVKFVTPKEPLVLKLEEVYDFVASEDESGY